MECLFSERCSVPGNCKLPSCKLRRVGTTSMGQKPHIYVRKQSKTAVVHFFRIELQHSRAQVMQINDAEMHTSRVHIYDTCTQFDTLSLLLYILCWQVSHMLTDMAYIAAIYPYSVYTVAYIEITCRLPRRKRARLICIHISSAQNAWRCCLTFPSRTSDDRFWC